MAVKVRKKRKEHLLVIWIVFSLMVLGMGVLVSKLWTLQVRQRSGFEDVFRSQSVRRVRLPAVRGKIYDRNGEVLADSVPSYCIAIFTEELRAPKSMVAKTLALMHEVWAGVGRRPDVTYQDVKEHIALRDTEPLVLYKNLTPEEIARWRIAFEKRTAPPAGSLTGQRRRIPGLDLGRPVANGNQIVLNLRELKKRPTSTAANTLELVYEIAERIGVPRQIKYQDIKDHIYARRPLPLLAWKDIDEKTMARWADTCSGLAGTDIYYQPARTYPFAQTNAHLVGFTLEADAIREEEGRRVHFDIRGIKGRKGLESSYNDLLEGDPGYQLVQIDVSGFHHRDLQVQPPVPGGDLILSIDENIQRIAYEALTTRHDGENPEVPVKGACVVLDPNNGDVLAMASSPSFDPNIYMGSKAYRQALLKDTSARTYHRAVFGQYPPGSTFKPVVALGVLSKDLDYTNVLHVCHNPYYVGKRRMKCWIHSLYGEHGSINIRHALMYSCNVFMFEMAQEKGFEPIHDMAEQFGIGQYAGLFPDLEAPPELKDLKYGNLPDRALNTIDLCNMAIGQGAITASPLQMAMVAATIANGGRLYRPRLVQKFRYNPDEEYRVNPVWAIRQIDAPIEAFEVVRGGMYDVVQDPEGTAKAARVDGIKIAGKTGSAQYRKRVDGQIVNSVHTWMISYAPFDFPRYAVAMIVEDGVSGGRSVGPRLHDLYTKIFEYDGTLAKEARR